MSPIRAGDVFLVNHPSDAPTPHYCIALCDEAGNPPSAIIVPINSKTNNTDPTVTLVPGDHPVILHESSVTYALAISASAVYLSEKILADKGPLPPAVFDRVLDGVEQSKRTPNGIRRRMREISAAGKGAGGEACEGDP